MRHRSQIYGQGNDLAANGPALPGGAVPAPAHHRQPKGKPMPAKTQPTPTKPHRPIELLMFPLCYYDRLVRLCKRIGVSPHDFIAIAVQEKVDAVINDVSVRRAVVDAVAVRQSALVEAVVGEVAREIIASRQAAAASAKRGRSEPARNLKPPSV